MRERSTNNSQTSIEGANRQGAAGYGQIGSLQDVTISAIPHAPNADVKPFLIEQNDNLSTLMQTRNQISETAAPTRS